MGRTKSFSPDGVCAQRQRQRFLGASNDGQVRREAGVLQSQRHVLGATPGDDGRCRAVRQQLEVGVPDPGDVAAVGDVVVQEQEQALLARHGGDGAQHLVESGRVLAEEDLHAPAVDLEALLPPERGVDRLDAGAHRFDVEAQRQAAGEGRERVVGVVEAAQLAA